ncbi:MAG TPA: Sir2 family NAD-dependent protein deacetylase [Acidimicrobiia bacterium]|nr:Sir2 family NAD-dependent protein deacetylase [Acidimicrobiia bacterium]
MTDSIMEAAQVLVDHLPILAFTGAGISTESGIPDFRGPNGLWTKMDPADFTIERYLADPERRKRGWRMHAEGSLWGARATLIPNAAHLALVDLYRHQRLVGCVTQNVDGLHLKAGLPEEAVAEVHGHVRSVRCYDCGLTWPTEEILLRVDQGEEEPRCEVCGGIIKTTTVMFGENLPEAVVERAWTLAHKAQSVLAIGTTLGVWPAAEIPFSMAQAGKPLVIVNEGETDMDRLATVRLEGKAGTVVSELARSIAG